MSHVSSRPVVSRWHLALAAADILARRSSVNGPSGFPSFAADIFALASGDAFIPRCATEILALVSGDNVCGLLANRFFWDTLIFARDSGDLLTPRLAAALFARASNEGTRPRLGPQHTSSSLARISGDIGIPLFAPGLPVIEL